MTIRKGWLVGVNAPGFQPDNEPRAYPSYTAASLALQYELVVTRETLPDQFHLLNGEVELVDEDLQRAADEVAESARAKGPVSVEFLGLVHWMERAE